MLRNGCPTDRHCCSGRGVLCFRRALYGTSLEIFAPLTDVFRAVIPNSGFFGLERECAVIVQKEKEKKAVVVRVRAAWAGPD